jgi:hypothetical protein
LEAIVILPIILQNFFISFSVREPEETLLQVEGEEEGSKDQVPDQDRSAPESECPVGEASSQKDSQTGEKKVGER